MLGIDPGPFTVGQLVAMLEARERSSWARTSSLMAFLAQTASALAGKPKKFKPSDFDPFSQKQKHTHRMGAAEFGTLLGIKRRKPEGKTHEDRNDPGRDRGPVDAGPDDRLPG